MLKIGNAPGESLLMQQAEILMGKKRPIRTAADGFRQGVENLAGGWIGRRAMDEQQAEKDAYADSLASILGGAQANITDPTRAKMLGDIVAGRVPQLMEAALGGYMTDMFREKPKDDPWAGTKVVDGNVLRMTDAGPETVYSAPREPKTDPDILEINQLHEAMATVPEGSPQWRSYDDRLMKISTSAPATQIGINPGEPAANKALGEAIGGRLASQIESGDKAYGNLQALNLMESAAGQYEQAGGSTGALADPTVFATSLMQAAGFDPTSLGLPADAGPAQVLNSLSNKLTLGKIGGEDGMPANNFSDADRKFIESTVPRLTDTPSAFRAKVLIDRRMAERSIQIAATISDGYSNGLSAAEISRQVAEIKRQPLFGDGERESFRSLMGEPGTRQAEFPTYDPNDMSDEALQSRLQQYMQIPVPGSPAGPFNQNGEAR